MTSDTLTLADELVLLAVQTSPTAHTAAVLEVGVIGAEVVDLALAGRIEMRDGRAVVTEPAPLGQPLLDARLTDLAEAGKPQKLHRYLETRRREAQAAYLYPHVVQRSFATEYLRRGRESNPPATNPGAALQSDTVAQAWTISPTTLTPWPMPSALISVLT